MKKSHLIAVSIVIIQAMLAYLAFGDVLNNDCDEFPCRVQKLYNENFLAIPVISQICNIYPFLNISAAAIMIITLRNNFIEFYYC